MRGNELNLPVPLPDDLENRYREVEQSFFALIQSGNPDGAFDAWSRFYPIMVKKQPMNKRFNKGGPLHNMGLAKLFKNEPGEAVRFFILAYIEDILNETEDFGSNTTPAFKTLEEIFKLSDSDFSAIRNVVREQSSSKIISNPQIVFKIYAKDSLAAGIISKASKIHLLIWQRYSMSQLPGVWEKRVFVGGDYHTRFSELYKITTFVKKAGFEPIIASEFKMSPMLIHHDSLLLLHNCRFAIFDMAMRSGQLMEAERTADYEINPLFVCDDKFYADVSQMVTTFGKDIKTYQSDFELEQLVKAYLNGI